MFYFIPNLDSNAILTGKTPQPITAVGSFTYQLSSGQVEHGVIEIFVQAGETALTLQDGLIVAVPDGQGNYPLDIDRVQQRLKYLGYTGGVGEEIIVTGDFSQQAPQPFYGVSSVAVASGGRLYAVGDIAWSWGGQARRPPN